ncbi:MAG: magnesium-dependent phosphatase-1 [Candidatus Freyarchaeota archaeon]|nr:magnesium-dependent phosphatase-1 [Candidatus Jordarchaeia archaeon]MBS7270482.1 magnesium-dependent phosphatase-1 [Candidatus Jordarchaeia archaeon]MBS7281244.1 magnesium-dependent phosphatase-1 [Candidatus Jordarchaeia archaeon]
MPIKLIVFDVDETLWSVSVTFTSFLKPPLRLVEVNEIRDSQEAKVKLFPEVRELLKTIKEKGILMSIASLNDPEPNLVMECLKLFKIADYFIYPQVNHKGKNRNIKTILKLIKEKEGIQIDYSEIIFVDDQELNTRSVMKGCPGIKAVHLGTDIKNIGQILNLI